MFPHFSPTKLFCGVAACLILSGNCFGAVTVTVSDGAIQAGGTTTVDVLITSDDLPNDVLHQFDVDLSINQDNATAGTQLIFVNPQSEAFLVDPRYVFFGENGNTGSDAVFNNATATTVGPQTELNVLDFAVDAIGDDTEYVIGDSTILLQLDLTHDVGAVSPALTVGNTFDISIDPFSIFEDLNMLITPALNSGTITVVAIPEPSSALMLLGIVGGPMLFRRRR